MENVITSNELLGAIPAITIIIQALKIVPAIKKYSDWFPILSIVLGIAAGIILMPQDIPIAQKILQGLVYGTSASGVYSGVKSVGTIGNGKKLQ